MKEDRETSLDSLEDKVLVAVGIPNKVIDNSKKFIVKISKYNVCLDKKEK